jgi:hypothetical protein
MDGLIACYVAGIPFLRNGLAGDIVYTAALFGLFEALQYKFSSLKQAAVNTSL